MQILPFVAKTSRIPVERFIKKHSISVVTAGDGTARDEKKECLSSVLGYRAFM